MRNRSRTRAPSPRLAPLVALVIAILALAGCESRSAPPAPSAAPAPPRAASASAEPSAAPDPGATAPSARPSASPTDATSEKPQPFLWKVTKGDKTSHLFGTMHLGTDAEKELHPIVFKTLAAARVVFFEANVFEANPLEMAGMMMLPAGESVKSKITPARWEALVGRLGGLLMPESALERMKPWALAAMLTQDMLPTTEPMDKVLYDRAKADGKPLKYLEGVEEQVGIIEKALGASELDDMLGDLPLMEKMTKELARSYQAGDLPALTKVAFDPVEMKKHPALFDSVLYGRNKSWVPKILAELDAGGAFIAVGAAHLVGPDSVVALLEAKGLTVSRVAVR